MEYPKNWEAEVAAWGEDVAPDVDILIVKDDEGVTAFRVKGIDWLATAKANWKKLTAALLATAAVITAVVVAVKLLTDKDD